LLINKMTDRLVDVMSKNECFLLKLGSDYEEEKQEPSKNVVRNG